MSKKGSKKKKENSKRKYQQTKVTTVKKDADNKTSINKNVVVK